MTISTLVPSNRTILRLAAALTAAVLFFSCQSAGTSGDAPEWLSEYPADPAYYVGIGGSSTGNLAEDREKAAAAARSDLAAQISAQVSSDLTVATSGGSGTLTESVERTVSESVEQNLKSVETVDAWISPEMGAWVYVRLSKAEWAVIVAREITDLTLRTNGPLAPVAAGRITEAEAFAALGRSRRALTDSPWGPQVKDESFGSGGFLNERIDTELAKRLGGLSISAAVSPATAKFGVSRSVSGMIRSSSGTSVGNLPLLLSEDGTNRISFVTESDGSFGVTLPGDELELGTLRLILEPDLSEWSLDPGAYAGGLSELEVGVNPLLLGVAVDSSVSSDLAGMDGAVGDWISHHGLPVVTVPSGRGDSELLFSWTVFDFPRSDKFANAPYISQVGAVITLVRNGEVLLTSDIDPFKDGGLDWYQAHIRCAEGLLKRMADDVDLAEELEAALR